MKIFVLYMRNISFIFLIINMGASGSLQAKSFIEELSMIFSINLQKLKVWMI